MDTTQSLAAACAALADRIDAHVWHPDAVMTYFGDTRESGRLFERFRVALHALRAAAEAAGITPTLTPEQEAAEASTRA